ncbi:5372_t:CDS:10 [Scutellospora calospora]|uniref:5372_t:CDS:1 n=1 Tax=Scutellospora calospora TaxID=85575 RepID=A0ACA9JUA9_9GLOM|nr:5372_t:CDS:10 [Scutellospora calospora]
MDQDQEAINTLKQLGVTEARAREALSKSNGDLQRAANFIFENQSTDPEETPDLAPLGTDSQTNNNWEDGDNKMLGYLDPNANNPSSFENDIQMAMDMSKNPYPDLKDGYNSQAVVLYNGNKNWQNGCWDDQPAKRVKLDTTPLGLRPVIDFYYATSFFQALFHIPVFRLSLLAYHPTKDNWGNVEGYWKGQKHYNSTDDYNRKSYNNINRSATLKFIHEFQKLFGFLSLSQRTYGDSSFLMDALDFDEKATWNEVEGKYNGPDLLRGSIEHFKRKCRKAEEKDSYDDDAQQTTTWLERVLDKVEQKLSVLLEKKDELEQKIKQMFDTPDMKEIHYRLKAVLVHNGQTGQGNHWAYIWVSRCSRPDILCTSTMDNGSWMKFQDTVVEDALEEVVLNEPGGIYPNNSVYTLFYVNANVDYNFPNIVDIIPDSLKAFVEKDNQILEEEIANQYRQVDSELPDSNAMDSTWESDSTACGGSPDSEKTIQLNINTIFQQANNIKIYDAKILKRSAKTAGWSWDDPILLDEKYRKDQRYIEVVKAFEEFKEITQYIVEGWEQMVEKNDFISAIAYFHRAITLENAWISNITFSSKFMVNARKNELVEAIEKATFVHRTFLVFVEPKNCRSDVLYFEFCQQWLNLSEHIPEPTNEAYRNSIAKLIDDYAVAIDSYDGEYTREILFDKIDTIPTDSDDTLYERYYKLTWKCKDVFEKYNVPEL